MKLSRRHLFFGILGLFLIGIIYGYLYLSQSHRNIQEEDVRYTLTPTELEARFRNSESHLEIADKVIQTRGEITALDIRSVTLDGKVEVSLVTRLPDSLEKGIVVSIKGRCVGYDDLLQVVKVDQATLSEVFQ